MTACLQRSMSPMVSGFHLLSNVGAAVRRAAPHFDGTWNTVSIDGAAALAGGPW